MRHTGRDFIHDLSNSRERIAPRQIEHHLKPVLSPVKQNVWTRMLDYCYLTVQGHNNELDLIY